MINPITIEEFLQKAEKLPVLDARAPKEYEAGHILQAQSFPIFTDDERAIVGTSYKQQGHDPAVLLGLDLFGPKMSQFVKEATKIAPDKEVLLHCWRGGMRSGAMAWLLSFAGFKVHLLQGGYKAYRHFIQEQFAKPKPILILSGFTGSGKTDILPFLQQDEGDLRSRLLEIIQRVGATGPSDLGRVMGVASKELAGQADGRAISSAVGALLNNTDF